MYVQTLPILLASKSPRRQELLRAMDLQFSVLQKDVDEGFPSGLNPAQIAVHIAEKKAAAFLEYSDRQIVITADTIVAFGDEILGKPEDPDDARQMLSKLSGSRHQVFTGVSLSYQQHTASFSDLTEVYFRALSAEQIDYYIKHYRPMDKAGAYGIQDWLGMVAVERIEGSYTNVMGLPTERLYQALMAV